MPTYQPPNAGFPTDPTSSTPYAGAAQNTPTVGATNTANGDIAYGTAYGPANYYYGDTVHSTPQSYTAPASISSSQLAPTPAPNFQSPQPTPIYPTGGLASTYGTPPPLGAEEQKAQGLTTSLQDLNNQLSQEAGFTNAQYAQYGFGTTKDANGNITGSDSAMPDLQAKLTAVTNEGLAIPSQFKADAVTHAGDVTSGQNTQQTYAAQAKNAVEALQVSSIIAAHQGQLATAKLLVDKAVQQKFGPLEAQQKAQTANLDLILKSPAYDAETKQRAADAAVVAAQNAAQLDLEKTNYTNAQNEVLKYAGIADASTLSAMQQAQTPAQVAQIASAAGYSQPDSGRYKDSVTTTTDAFGNSVQHVRIFDTVLGKFVDNAPAGATAASLNASTGGSSNGGSTGPSNGGTTGTLNFAQYGKLANTDFNPSNTTDQMAQAYLDRYIKSGAVPTASSLGRGIKPAAFAAVQNRAADLYFKATGQPLPNPDIIKGYQTQLIGNNKLLNNLNVQEGTIGKNAQLLLQNLTSNNLNANVPAINSFIDNFKNMLGDPNVAQFLAQNTTVGNELGSLLSLKNAQGTTVHDKLEAAGLISPKDSQAQITAKIQVLLKEAVNAHDAIASANAELYNQTDPLLQDANNPARAQAQFGTTKSGQPFDYQSAKSAGYTDKEIQDYITSN